MTNEADFMRALSARLRDLREDAGLRQDDISRKAKGLGLAWGRSSVAALEAGARNLSAFEWLLLPSIYGCTPDDLLNGASIQGAATDAGPDETDRKVALRLGVSAKQVQAQAVALWGRSLAAERDARAGVGGDRSSQAARGHVTRALIAELSATA